MAIATFVNWSGNLAVSLIFPQMQESITDYSFLPFTILLVVLLVILFIYLPETKGISVQEIEALFQVKKMIALFSYNKFGEQHRVRSLYPGTKERKSEKL